MLEQGFEAFEKQQMNEDALEKRDIDNFVFDQEGDPENKTLDKNDSKKDIALKPKSFENPILDKSKNIE